MKPRLESAPPTLEDLIAWTGGETLRFGLTQRFWRQLWSVSADQDRRDAELMFLAVHGGFRLLEINEHGQARWWCNVLRDEV